MIKGEIRIGDRVLVTATEADLRITGATYDPGEIVTIEEIESRLFRGAWKPDRSGGPWLNRSQVSRMVEAPAPVQSQHLADLKPRGVKAPLHLIPWDAVAPGLVELIPPAICSILERRNPSEILYCLNTLGVRLEQVAEVFAYGAKKYARDNWRTFAWDDSARDEYFGAICRHVLADARGEKIDPESGQPHLAHAACGCLIWRWHELRIERGEARPDV